MNAVGPKIVYNSVSIWAFSKRTASTEIKTLSGGFRLGTSDTSCLSNSSPSSGLGGLTSKWAIVLSRIRVHALCRQHQNALIQLPRAKEAFGACGTPAPAQADQIVRLVEA
jgi:hypothetical protein